VVCLAGAILYSVQVAEKDDEKSPDK